MELSCAADLRVAPTTSTATRRPFQPVPKGSASTTCEMLRAPMHLSIAGPILALMTFLIRLLCPVLEIEPSDTIEMLCVPRYQFLGLFQSRRRYENVRIGNRHAFFL